jgi:hypothetical protein
LEEQQDFVSVFAGQVLASVEEQQDFFFFFFFLSSSFKTTVAPFVAAIAEDIIEPVYMVNAKTKNIFFIN